jgi:hypothetical protein
MRDVHFYYGNYHESPKELWRKREISWPEFKYLETGGINLKDVPYRFFQRYIRRKKILMPKDIEAFWQRISGRRNGGFKLNAGIYVVIGTHIYFFRSDEFDYKMLETKIEIMRRVVRILQRERYYKKSSNWRLYGTC